MSALPALRGQDTLQSGDCVFSARVFLPAGFPPAELRVAEAVYEMVVDHPDCLHEGIADRAADKPEAATLQVFTHGVGLRRLRWNVFERPPRVLNRIAVHESPEIGVEAAELVADCQ